VIGRQSSSRSAHRDIRETVSEETITLSAHGSEQPERAMMAFILAMAVHAPEAEVVPSLRGNIALLTRRSRFEHVSTAGLSAPKRSVNAYSEMGTTLSACAPERNRTRWIEKIMPNTRRYPARSHLLKSSLMQPIWPSIDWLLQTFFRRLK
jgi:predicted peroxiredoxin